MGDTLREFLDKPTFGLGFQKVAKETQTNEKWRYIREIRKSDGANQNG